MWFLVMSICGLGAAFLANFQIQNLLAIVLVQPLFGAQVLCVIPSTELKTIRVWTLAVTFITLLACILLWANFNWSAAEPFGSVVGFSAGWQGLVLVRLEFGIDSLSLWMILLTQALMPLAVLCSWTTMTKHATSFMALLLVLESCLFGAFSALDLLSFYVLYECSLLPMFLLIGLGGSRPRKVRAAYLLVLYTLIGSLAMLPCMLLMWSQAGSTSFMLLVLQDWEPSRQLVLWWGLFLAFAVKVPMIPVHLWLPEAHVEQSTAGSVLLAGVLLKLGTYGLLRFNLSLFAYANAYYGPFILCLSLIGLIYQSLSTLRQVDLKKLIAYSSVAHMSMVTLALFTMSDLGMIQATFLMLAHGIQSPALFLCVGALYDRTHTKALKYLGGAQTQMPLFSIMLFVFSLCNMAMPLTPNFLAEFLCLCSVFAHNTVALAGALIAVVLAAAYSMWAYARVVHGMPKPYVFAALTDLNRREFWCFVPLILMTLWLGLKPNAVLDSLSSSLLFWHQASLATKDPAAWALALL